MLSWLTVPVFDAILINMMLALSIYLTLFTGLLSLANAGFMAIGAYVTVLLLTGTTLPLGAAFGLSISIAVLVALLLGLPVLRLQGVYLAIATLGFGEIVRLLLLNGDKLINLVKPSQPGSEPVVLFNGAEGITLPFQLDPVWLGLPKTTWELLAYLCVLLYFFMRLQRSQLGRILASIRQDEAAAAALGIAVVRYKLLAFVLGAAIAAGAGALSVPVVRVIEPANYSFSQAVNILAWAVLGGTTHWAGPLVGAGLLTSLPELLRFLKEQRDVVNGLILMLAIIYLPRGLADPRFWQQLWRLPKKREQHP
ncbi:branched-chain amino acid ABC transporter permease [Leptolyngbya sp. FACHB-261]|uniref:branched-chain amino acid ABC transporter permease n=1 Tax=Leptolyngbya sp. FACHB-261 TaxID=2692806 RepID=UPI001682C323|nr:branched-chain amino acid ABC transporter permease [Leptolyngbya sp. FACHB-261]MBD2105079.1 branched-chain amino acid ABC transporter permease [Leptolyngbya sp. FACHB-261]